MKDKITISQNTITKNMIAQHIHNSMGLSKTLTEKLILQLFEEIVTILKNGDNIKLPSFGTFSKHSKKARPGMNLQTNEKIIIAPKEVIRFVPSRILKNRVNDAK